MSAVIAAIGRSIANPQLSALIIEPDKERTLAVCTARLDVLAMALVFQLLDINPCRSERGR